MGEDYFKTAGNWTASYVLFIENKPAFRWGKGRIFITVIEKNINIITNCIQIFTSIASRFRMKAWVGKKK